MATEGIGGPSSDRNDDIDVERSIHSPFRVLGIALVVDQLGKGSKLSFRYPASPLTEETEDLFFRLPARQMAKLFRPKATLCGQPMTLSVGGTVFCCYAVLMEDNISNPSGGNDTGSNSDATGAGNEEDATNATGKTNSPIDQLVLFSVIVALAPPLNTQNLPITGWLESYPHDYHHVHPNLNKPSKGKHKERQTKTSDSASSRIRKVSPSFLSIRRVHVSLARLCRVMEREERRCRYVSGQTHRFEQVKKELKRDWLRQSSESVISTTNLGTNTGTMTSGSNSTAGVPPPSSSSSSTTAVKATPASANNSPVSISSTKTAKVQTSGMGTTDHRAANPKLHRRTHSFSFLDRDVGSGSTSTHPKQRTKPADTTGGSARDQFENSEEFAQEFLDTIMSLPPASSQEKEGENGGEDLYYGHEGNLARELIQVFHALARNNHDFPPTPDTLLSGRDAAVFLNRHLLVPIEAISPPPSVVHPFYDDMFSPTGIIPLVQPYQTLLFPYASASELLDSLTSSSSGPPPRRLQLLLRTIHPQKSLADVAMETNIPLQVIIDMASYMIEQGACIASSVLTRNSQLACRSIELIPKVSLLFAQKFGDALPVFHLASYLTRNGRSLGDAMVAWQNSPDDRWLLERLEASNLHAPLGPRWNKRHGRHYVVGGVVGDVTDDEQENVVLGDNGGDEADEDNNAAAHTNALEDLLYRMTIWLCSHGILVPLEEYLVGTSASLLVGHNGRGNNDTAVADDDDEEELASSERKADSHTGSDYTLSEDDDHLYKELLDAGCLEGSMALSACSWRTNIDAARLRSFAVQHPRIRVVTRMPDSTNEAPQALHHKC